MKLYKGQLTEERYIHYYYYDNNKKFPIATNTNNMRASPPCTYGPIHGSCHSSKVFHLGIDL